MISGVHWNTSMLLRSFKEHMRAGENTFWGYIKCTRRHLRKTKPQKKVCIISAGFSIFPNYPLWDPFTASFTLQLIHHCDRKSGQKTFMREWDAPPGRSGFGPLPGAYHQSVRVIVGHDFMICLWWNDQNRLLRRRKHVLIRARIARFHHKGIF
jgi:hypothetical protein